MDINYYRKELKRLKAKLERVLKGIPDKTLADRDNLFTLLTEKARRVIFFSRYEASQYGSELVESEHLLMGVIREDKALINQFLPGEHAGDHLRRSIEKRIPLSERAASSHDILFSSDCKNILEYSAEEARSLNHPYIGAEHLLLGILREEQCIAAQILREYGLELNAVREGLARSGAA